jgi:hypothetical protein
LKGIQYWYEHNQYNRAPPESIANRCTLLQF